MKIAINKMGKNTYSGKTPKVKYLIDKTASGWIAETFDLQTGVGTGLKRCENFQEAFDWVLAAE